MEKIELPKITDSRGSLSFFENNHQIPFAIKTVSCLYSLSDTRYQLGYACKKNEEFIVSLSGSFEVSLCNGREEKIYILDCPYSGLYIPNMYWCRISNFSKSAVALIVSSVEFEHRNYIDNYEIFCEMVN